MNEFDFSFPYDSNICWLYCIAKAISNVRMKSVWFILGIVNIPRLCSCALKVSTLSMSVCVSICHFLHNARWKKKILWFYFWFFVIVLLWIYFIISFISMYLKVGTCNIPVRRQCNHLFRDDNFHFCIFYYIFVCNLFHRKYCCNLP